MKKKFRVLKYPVLFLTIAALIFVLAWSQTTSAQRPTTRAYKFKKTTGITIPIATRGDFDDRLSLDPSIPQKKDAVIQLAQKLYLPEREEIKEECGEGPFGRLFISLTNPDIPDAARDEVDNIIDANTPSLPKTYTSGHFKFYYTDNDLNSNHNVTLSEIQATAIVLNNAWSNFAQNFIEPKHYITSIGDCPPRPRKMVNVKVYDLGSSLYGATSSYWNYIMLHSRFVVKDSCKRQSTSAHELFHRVQYSYGYVSGNSIYKWAVEGTASWAQKYKAPNVGDWMRRMNQGLNSPDLTLISGRAYNACHFWVYLGQRGNGEVATIKDVWSNFKTNGHDMKAAVETTIQSRVPNGSSMDQFVGWWNFANFYKDITNASPSFDYAEDELEKICGGITYGPLAQVPRITRNLNVGSSHTINGTVAPYGADYYVFNIGSSVQRIKIKCTGATLNFGYAVIEIKNDMMVDYESTPAGQKKDYDFKKTIAPGRLSHVAFIVIGNPQGGNYSIEAKGSLLPIK